MIIRSIHARIKVKQNSENTNMHVMYMYYTRLPTNNGSQ